jgi:hypothetical protein
MLFTSVPVPRSPVNPLLALHFFSADRAVARGFDEMARSRYDS